MPMSYHARMTKPLFQVTGRNGACGKMKRAGRLAGRRSSGTMGSKSWPSAPRPCSQMMLATGFLPVSISIGGSSDSSFMFTTIAATGGAGLAHDDLTQARQHRFELVPYPAREVLARRIFE